MHLALFLSHALLLSISFFLKPFLKQTLAWVTFTYFTV